MKKDTLAVLGLLAFTVLMVYGYEHKVPWMMSVVFIGIALVCIPEGVKMIVTRRPRSRSVTTPIPRTNTTGA
jgi:hypothetical protein